MSAMPLRDRASPSNGDSTIRAATTNVRNIEIEIHIAGQRRNVLLPPQPNQTYSFRWDGRDGYGRPVQGQRAVHVRIGYVFDGAYEAAAGAGPQSFGLPGRVRDGSTLELRPSRRDVVMWTGKRREFLGTLDAQGLGIGGWSIASHHFYDPVSRRLYMGNGEERVVDPPGQDLQNHVFGYVRGMAVDRDGSVIVADAVAHRLWRIEPSTGNATLFAGTGTADYSGDGGLAVNAALNYPQGVAIDSNGRVYFADTLNHSIRAVEPNGTITTVAGNGTSGFDADYGTAPYSQFNTPNWLAIGPDDSVYVHDYGNTRGAFTIRKQAWCGSAPATMTLTLDGGPPKTRRASETR